MRSDKSHKDEEDGDEEEEEASSAIPEDEEDESSEEEEESESESESHTSECSSPSMDTQESPSPFFPSTTPFISSKSHAGPTFSDLRKNKEQIRRGETACTW